MEMRKYLVTIHEDGHITASEYEEPQGFVYCASEASVVRDAYNHALRDVKTVLKFEESRCVSNSRVRQSDKDWVASWTARKIECEVFRTAIEKLFRKS